MTDAKEFSASEESEFERFFRKLPEVTGRRRIVHFVRESDLRTPLVQCGDESHTARSM
jgi:hypothetical protein